MRAGLMRRALAEQPAAPHHVQQGSGADVLAAISDPQVNLAIWQRRLPAQAACEAVKRVVAGEGEVRLTCDTAQLESRLAAAMRAEGWQDMPGLRADVTVLAARFAEVMACPLVSVRLEVVTGDACRKFHADYVKARLISSYAGPGSEWLDNDEAQSPATARIRRLSAGDVALFKGRLWTDRPIIHRSPPLAGTGQRRLVLVIDDGSEDN
jgi:hypothetical protein